MKFLEVYQHKEGHSNDEKRLYEKIRKYENLLQKMA